jgi:RNA polymerase sigma-70 factor, ECF subfamily
MTPPTAEITRLLRAWGNGDQAAFDRLAPLVYGELHRMAGRCMQRENPGNTLQATALVNEAYLRLVDVNGVRWQDRAHFFAISAQMMRRILVDAARARGSGKRGGGAPHLNLNESIDAVPARDNQLVDLDEALNALAELDPRKAKVVEMCFFGGLSVEETAEVLKISPQSVMRDWKLARVWLLRELSA